MNLSKKLAPIANFNKNESRNSYLIIFLFILYTFILILPSLNESFWFLDDQLLVDVPFLLPPFDWASVRALFTLGAHADFYPVRDLHTFFDNLAIGASTDGDSGFAYRIHNFIFFALSYLLLFIIFLKFKMNQKTAAFVASLWFLNPVHLEMVTWISGRKDILSLFYFLLCTFLFLKEHVFLALLAFMFSLLSKASFSLIPLVVLIGVYFKIIPLTKKKHLYYLLIAVALGAANSILQNYLYSEINDMRAAYTWDYRILSSLSALGRMLVGIFYYPVNSVDVFNFGEWLELNKIFLPVGIVFLVFCCFVTIYALKNYQRSILLFLIAILFLYLPISGLFFPHRSFYSVRYIEPMLLVAFSVLAIYFKDKIHSLNIKILGFLLLLSSAALLLDSSNYESTYTATKKSLDLHPKSVALMTTHLSSIQIAMTYKRSDERLRQEGIHLKNEIAHRCKVANLVYSPNGDSCYVYIKDHYNDYETELSVADLVKLGAPLTWLTLDQKIFIKTLSLNKFDELEKLNADSINLRYFQYTKQNRLEYLKYFCAKKDYAKAQSSLTDFIQRKLLRPTDVNGFAQANISPRLDWRSCVGPALVLNTRVVTPDTSPSFRY